MEFPQIIHNSVPMYDLSNAFSQLPNYENDDEFMEIDGEVKSSTNEFSEIDESQVTLKKINDELKVGYLLISYKIIFNNSIF